MEHALLRADRADRARGRDRERRPDPPRASGSARAGGEVPPLARLPLLAIPGNHDIPYTFPARFTSTWDEFVRLWETTEPVYHANGVYVVGLNSVRPWRHQSGGLRQSQIERAPPALSEAPEGAIRIVALHHHLLGAPWRSSKKPVARRNRVLAALVDGGRGADPRRSHPPGGGQRAARVRGDGRRRARRRRLDRPRPRPAAAEAPRRGARPPRLRDRRSSAIDVLDLHLARRRLGAHGRAALPAGSEPLSIERA